MVGGWGWGWGWGGGGRFSWSTFPHSAHYSIDKNLTLISIIPDSPSLRIGPSLSCICSIQQHKTRTSVYERVTKCWKDWVNKWKHFEQARHTWNNWNSYEVVPNIANIIMYHERKQITSSIGIRNHWHVFKHIWIYRYTTELINVQSTGLFMFYLWWHF